ncbi:unnamed protein product [Bemisia tabaci]|uniref:Acetyl-CoA acetyltransferase, mitochondrial n=2 Tax=Bemisia tabaci TaxID=7038 RepID=A0A9P0G5I0_BEMTA|nr:unnamed protein product [Bemisia tabaci]
MNFRQLRSFSTSRSLSIQDVFILAAARTPMGSFRSALGPKSATELGALAIQAALHRAKVSPTKVDDVYMGNVCSAGLGQAPARQAAIFAGIPTSAEATTVNKVCASGLKAISIGAQTITLNQNEIVVAGGMESMSNVPFYLRRGDTPYGGVLLQDGIVFDGLTDVYNKIHMGNCAENTVKKIGISREEQDEYALNSYKKSAAAYSSGRISAELTPVEVPVKKGSKQEVFEDEEYRKINFEKFTSLRPAFLKENGTITAGNASTLNDGGAAVVLASEAAAKGVGSEPIARIIGAIDAATDPIDFPLAPALGIPKLLAKYNLKTDDISQWEINEAFSAVVLAAIKKLNLDPQTVNPNGGAVSLGHPIGMSGARLIVHLCHSLKKGEKGVASICNGGGGSTSLVIEKLGDPIKGPVLTLYTKYPCPLCDVLKDELKKSFNHRFSALREVNIAAPENSKWLDLYKNDIPVLFLNGIFVCKHRLDHEKIDEMLKKYESK